MSTQISTSKRLLTLFGNKLEFIITKLKEEKLEDLGVDPNLSLVVPSDDVHRLEEGISVVESAIAKVEKSLQEFAAILDNPTATALGKEQEDVEDYVSKSETTLSIAFDYVIILQARLRALSSSINQRARASRPAESNNESAPMSRATAKALELPPLPIPTFGGNIWEWDSFWSIFDANIHSQNLSTMVKFNYLLNALKGEARNSITKFQVTSENYANAIQFLHNKYNNKEMLVNTLVEKLDNSTLQGNSVKDQRHLLEQLQVVTAQLMEKGEEVDSSWLIKKVLSKFPDYIKRKVVVKKQSLSPTTPFTMSLLFQYVDEILSAEEMFLLYSDTKTPSRPTQRTKDSPRPQRFKQTWAVVCMYCDGTHSSKDCMKYATAQERSAYLRQQNLCLICASSKHSTNQCKGRMCFNCKGAHHTSCCFKVSYNGRSQQAVQGLDVTKEAPIRAKSAIQQQKNSVGHKSTSGSTTKVQSHAVINQDNNSGNTPTVETSILQQQSAVCRQPSQQPCLPVGELTVKNHKTNERIRIPVLIDTGAELSFVDSSLAEQLELTVLEEKEILLHTFGSEKVNKSNGKCVRMEVWDSEGSPHCLDLLTYDILTRSLRQPNPPASDIEFIRSLDIPIAWNYGEKKITPRVLLGCDHLWSFMRSDKPAIPLPSGMYILPTKIGYVISGKAKAQEGLALQVSQSLPGKIDQWENYWSMDTIGLYSVNSEENEVTQEEQEHWDKFWAIDAAGTEEFAGTETQARALLDEQVWTKFNETIERRPDGYYVRLPWKDQYPYLPDNRSLAFKILVNVWAAISRDEQLLDQYNNVFQEQLRQNIIELVEDDEAPTDKQVHYIPHQPVITPNKATTKLRVVFNASAHYKGCPSLNDVLHRGPVILPSLYGILLRFRMGNIAITSDVEKAFLQVRLQEQDRDATRCFWLRNHKEPPSNNNIITFRFTRVTFGIKSSPFLLAGTTHYHLDTYETESPLVVDIKRNLYVDNLLLTTDTLQDAVDRYHRTKQMFRDLNMNLRQFSSNSNQLMANISDSDKSSESCPKLLGLVWNLEKDAMLAVCRFPDTPLLTKRTVTSAIASIYDPLGWTIPLLLKPKIFLQELWKQGFDWDAVLPEGKELEWNRILEAIQGFEKYVPRYLAPKASEVIIVTFADASSAAMAACTYLCQGNNSSLLIAKSKLPSLQVQHTIPKLELNAITLAMRISNSVFTQLKNTLTIKNIFVFSDSEIVLSWLKLEPHREVGPFVFNRIVEVQRIAKHLAEQQCVVKIGYVASTENPADIATRGTTTDEFATHYWWTGPKFLNSPPSTWAVKRKIFAYPLEGSGVPNDISSGEIHAVQTLDSNDKELVSPSQARTITQAKRILAYVLRFIFNTIKKVNARCGTRIFLPLSVATHYGMDTGALSGPEIELAGDTLIRHHQVRNITKAIINSLKQLNIQQDHRGILRCYGRLGQANWGDDTKHPILILQKSFLAKLIIEDCHDKGHPGINHTIAQVRQKFWIPQLRSQVSALIRKCFLCQKFNNLPYKYPMQEDLPKERVIKSYPFQHVGLDYFGPLTITIPSGSKEKCYGAIITCMTTRLIHLDVVSDMTTIAFLHMLRRFFARRGIPRSITSDNAPTFQLGQTILDESLQAATGDPAISRELGNREITWRRITPFAPWQGGFYERLIKSVKHSLFKTLGHATVTCEELTTVLIEIESLLNTRPLTYMSSELEEGQILRPIDFLQKDMHVFYPIEHSPEDVDDATYLPADEFATLRTKQEAVMALQSSCKFTEKFWNVWQTQYLTALREKHVLNVGKKKGCAQDPTEGAVVLVSDPVLPRHCWKMGMISRLVANKNGTIREAMIRLPSKRVIRRPVNLLIPLELEQDESTTEMEQAEQEREKESQLASAQELEQSSQPRIKPVEERGDENTEDDLLPGQGRYNFRKRRHLNYDEDDEEFLMSPGTSRSILPITTLFQIVMIISLVHLTSSSTFEELTESIRSMQCIPGGMQLTSPNQKPYEVCAEQYCVQLDQPKLKENVSFPPEVILHRHLVQWKFVEEQSVSTIETTCPASPFCQSIQCTFCVTNILNPECWPTSAIFATAFLTYCVITGCYVFLYIPLVLGLPIRIIGHMVWTMLRLIMNCCRGLKRNTRGRALSRRRIAEILAISLIHIRLSLQCQQIDLFTYSSTICTKDSSTPCMIQLSEVFKISPFKKEACLRLSQNNTSIHEIRLQWKALRLTCEPVSDMFTRDTIYKVISSKRCPHSGSCKGEKCGSINSSTYIPELAEGNQYPGITACVESCGGPGCDCFFLSSGCLFYRIYALPVNNNVFEVFHCNRWTEEAEVQVSHYDGLRKTSLTTTELLRPNIPTKWNPFTITLTEVGIPPLPILNTQFISDGIRTAFWRANVIPALRCSNATTAEAMECEFLENCSCRPAEKTANCNCKNLSITDWFTNIRNQLPAVFPAISFRQDPSSRVQAIVSSMVTTEIILSFQDSLKSEILVDDAVCKVTADEITGCYNCAKGATAPITCLASKDNTQAEIVCESRAFTIPCNTTGIQSDLRFSLPRARIHMMCSASCGKLESFFEIGGILKYALSTPGLVEQWLQGETVDYSEFQWPDFHHIATVFLQWYKTTIIAVIGLALVIAITYITLSTCGIQLIYWIIKKFARCTIGVIVLCGNCMKFLYKTCATIHHNKQH